MRPLRRARRAGVSSAAPAHFRRASQRLAPLALCPPLPPTLRLLHRLRLPVPHAPFWGLSLALLEHTIVDPRVGRIVNANLAEYHVPVNADIQDIDVTFVDNSDFNFNPLGIRGIGEIGITGVAGACRTRCTTRPAGAFVTCRSRWTSCCFKEWRDACRAPLRAARTCGGA